jgi:hypothetical protein
MIAASPALTARTLGLGSQEEGLGSQSTERLGPAAASS